MKLFGNYLKQKWTQGLHSIAEIYAHIGLNQNLFRSTALDIITRLLGNAAFVCVHVVGRFIKRFLGNAWVEKSRVSALG